MRMNKKLLVASMSVILAGTWYVLDTQNEQNLVSHTSQGEAGLVQFEREAVEQVEGQNGFYPKELTMEDLVSGDVVLPSNSAMPEGDPEDRYDAKAEAWAKVDFDALRNEMPDNQFWSMAMPTSDEGVLERRAEKREALKETRARMTARHASEQEIRDYYTYQQSLSEDYVEAITLILNKYSDVLPEEDVSAQRLARTLHLSKLQEIPKQMTRAIEQRQAFVEEKSEWVADKAAYRAKLEAEAAEANRALGKI